MVNAILSSEPPMTRIFLSFDQDMHRLAAYQFLEPCLRDRRVLELGCGSGQGLRQLFALGAREVLGLDRDLRAARTRVAALEAVVTLRTFQPPRLDLGKERFDVIIVNDVGALSGSRDLLLELQAAMSAEGLLVVRAESGDRPGVAKGVSYGALLDLLEPAFPLVRVFGQSPFCGYSLVELTRQEGGDLDLFVDGALMGGAVEEVASYLVLCGPAAALHLDGAYGLVQVPSDGDAALDRWWDSLAQGAEEDSDVSAGGVTSATGRREQEGALPLDGSAAGLEGGHAPTPEEPRAPGPRTDLERLMDGKGGMVPRWRWPDTG